jgi:hypothetical protein
VGTPAFVYVFACEQRLRPLRGRSFRRVDDCEDNEADASGQGRRRARARPAVQPTGSPVLLRRIVRCGRRANTRTSAGCPAYTSSQLYCRMFRFETSGPTDEVSKPPSHGRMCTWVAAREHTSARFPSLRRATRVLRRVRRLALAIPRRGFRPTRGLPWALANPTAVVPKLETFGTGRSVGPVSI